MDAGLLEHFEPPRRDLLIMRASGEPGEPTTRSGEPTTPFSKLLEGLGGPIARLGFARIQVLLGYLSELKLISSTHSAKAKPERPTSRGLWVCYRARNIQNAG